LEVAANGSIVGNTTPVLSDLLNQLDVKLSTALTTLSDRIDNTNANLATFSKIAESVRGPAQRTPVDADCSMNVVINGVPEDRDSSRWRSDVHEIVSFLAGRTVEIADVIRIGGRYQAGRIRPVLLKLRSIWDRRILLSARRKLKDYRVTNHEDARIYIHEDEPVDVRRKNTLVRLKRKAENEGKTVTVLDDVMSINGVAIFSLQSGYINIRQS
jgi:hypothetical protein